MENRRVCRGWVVGVFLMLAGCGGISPPSAYYLLGSTLPMSPDQPPLENMAIGIGPVTLPGHLDRPQIVTRTGRHRIQVNEFHRWGDSLKHQFGEALVMNLSALLQTPRVTLYPWERALRPQYQVIVTVHQFDGQSAGTATLDAVWQVVDVGKNISVLTRRFFITTPVQGDGVAACVAAQSDAVDALSRDIARGVYGVAHGKDQRPL